MFRAEVQGACFKSRDSHLFARSLLHAQQKAWGVPNTWGNGTVPKRTKGRAGRTSLKSQRTGLGSASGNEGVDDCSCLTESPALVLVSYLVLSRTCCEPVIKLASMLSLSTIKPSFFPLLSLPAHRSFGGTGGGGGHTLYLLQTSRIWQPYWTCESPVNSKGKFNFKESTLTFK